VGEKRTQENSGGYWLTVIWVQAFRRSALRPELSEDLVKLNRVEPIQSRAGEQAPFTEPQAPCDFIKIYAQVISPGRDTFSSYKHLSQLARRAGWCLRWFPTLAANVDRIAPIDDWTAGQGEPG
jgi:hypothetical protein